MGISVNSNCLNPCATVNCVLNGATSSVIRLCHLISSQKLPVSKEQTSGWWLERDWSRSLLAIKVYVAVGVQFFCYKVDFHRLLQGVWVGLKWRHPSGNLNKEPWCVSPKMISKNPFHLQLAIPLCARQTLPWHAVAICWVIFSFHSPNCRGGISWEALCSLGMRMPDKEPAALPAQNSFHHQLQDGLDFKALWASNSMQNQPYILAIAGSNSPDKYH